MASVTPPPSSSSSSEYWCHHCDKRVSVETLPDQPDLICFDCKFGFVESIPFSTASLPDHPDQTTLGSQFIQVLRLLAQVARDDNPSSLPPPQPADLQNDNPLLRIQIHGEENDVENQQEEQEDDDDDEDRESVRSVEIEADSDDDDLDDDAEDDVRRRRRRHMLRLRLRDFATRARSGGRNRILDWAEILMGLENNSIELRFEDRYVGNPGDYVNEAEYEALLQNLADGDGRRGAPPASKTAVDGLEGVEVQVEQVCAICKDGVSVGEQVKEMPCGHGYHGDCIVTWLAARNTCPVCRFELPTDDPEYEEDKRKRSDAAAAAAAGGSTSVGN